MILNTHKEPIYANDPISIPDATADTFPDVSFLYRESIAIHSTHVQIPMIAATMCINI